MKPLRRAFSKGNWRVSRWNDGSVTIGSDDGHGSFGVIRMRRSKTNNLTEMEANAALILSSPKLFEASASALETLETVRGFLPDPALALVDHEIARQRAALEASENLRQQ